MFSSRISAQSNIYCVSFLSDLFPVLLCCSWIEEDHHHLGRTRRACAAHMPVFVHEEALTAYSERVSRHFGLKLYFFILIQTFVSEH